MSTPEERRMQSMFPGLGASPAVVAPPMRNLPAPRVSDRAASAAARAAAPRTSMASRTAAASPVSVMPAGLVRTAAPTTSRGPGLTADTAERLQSDYGYTQDQVIARSRNQPVGQVNNVYSNPSGNLTSSAPSSSSGGSGGSGSSAPAAPAAGGEAAAESSVDAQAALDAAIAGLLEGDFIDFQGSRAAELRRLQNLRNQMFGDAEFGTTGSVQRQEGLDLASRRRLAAQRAVGGMLQGGAYAGTQRGVGTIQQGEQAYNMQEMLRPFREQTAADRLREFGLEFGPEGREFNLSDFGSPDDLMGGWSTGTFTGRSAAARARQAAIERLAQRGINI